MSKSKAWENYKSKNKEELLQEISIESKKFTWGKETLDTQQTVTANCIKGFEVTLEEAEKNQGTVPVVSREWLELSLHIEAIKSILEDLKQEFQDLQELRKQQEDRT